jgi:hypothetical protein
MDCPYLAPAGAIRGVVVTADRRLDNTLQGGRHAGPIRWIEGPIRRHLPDRRGPARAPRDPHRPNELYISYIIEN